MYFYIFLELELKGGYNHALCLNTTGYLAKLFSVVGFPGGGVVKGSACQCRKPKRCGFNPWVRKIPWRRKWQPTPVFLHGKFHG